MPKHTITLEFDLPEGVSVRVIETGYAASASHHVAPAPTAHESQPPGPSGETPGMVTCPDWSGSTQYHPSRAEATRAGASQYFTGQLCGRNHRAPKYVNGSKCVACTMQRNHYNKLRSTLRELDVDPDLMAARLKDLQEADPGFGARETLDAFGATLRGLLNAEEVSLSALDQLLVSYGARPEIDAALAPAAPAPLAAPAPVPEPPAGPLPAPASVGTSLAAALGMMDTPEEFGG